MTPPLLLNRPSNKRPASCKCRACSTSRRKVQQAHLASRDGPGAKPWNIGLIVGPSGCGKSTIARNLWPAPFTKSASLTWPQHQSLLDSFPETLPIQEITALLSSVGFSSPPAWLRPFHVLSTGQQFRVSLARLLAESSNEPIVMDEFTSVVDRTVAQIGSAAVARVIRQAKKQFIAVTCHEDVEAWLNPDWVYRPAEQAFAWRSLRRRPAIDLVISRCSHTAWPLFARHHYLSADLNRSAVCFLATLHSQPVCFSSWLPFVARARLHAASIAPSACPTSRVLASATASARSVLPCSSALAIAPFRQPPTRP